MFLLMELVVLVLLPTTGLRPAALVYYYCCPATASSCSSIVVVIAATVEAGLAVGSAEVVLVWRMMIVRVVWAAVGRIIAL